MCLEFFVIFSDDGLNFFGICGDFLFTICYCIYLVILSSLLSVWLVVCLFCWSFQKKTALGFMDFLKGFSCLYLLQFCSDLSISCLLLAFEFVWSCSPSSFNCDIKVSILGLSSFLLWAFIAINFPLHTALNVSQRFWHIVSLFSLVSKNIFISAFISLFIQ